MKKQILAATTISAVMWFGQTAMASGPAVSEPNAKVEVVGAEIDDAPAKAVLGSVTLPLGQSYGAQVDGMAGEIDDTTATGIGGHLFWRDPDIAMLGLTAAKARAFSRSVNRYGIEGELYRGDLTFSAFGGKQTGGGLGNMAYGGVAASWYATPNFLLQLSGDALDDRRAASLGFEWQPDAYNDGFTFFAKGTRGNQNVEAVQMGVRVYLGSAKSLQDRHRKDDPVNPLFNNLVTLAGQSQGAICRVKLSDQYLIISHDTSGNHNRPTTDNNSCYTLARVNVGCDGLIDNAVVEGPLAPTSSLTKDKLDRLVRGKRPDDFDTGIVFEERPLKYGFIGIPIDRETGKHREEFHSACTGF